MLSRWLAAPSACSAAPGGPDGDDKGARDKDLMRDTLMNKIQKALENPLGCRNILTGAN